jgi:hypothetical protein
MQLNPEFEQRIADSMVKKIDELKEARLVIKAMIEMLGEAGRKKASIIFGVHLKSGLSEEKVRDIFKDAK